jgi:hypothetical protein
MRSHKLGTVPVFAQRKWDCPLPKPFLALCLIACSLGLGVAVRADSKRTPSPDQESLKRLGVNPSSDLDQELFAPDANRPKPPNSQSGPGKEGDDWKGDLLRELGAAATPEEENPLLEIARQMRLAEGLIAQSKSGPHTQGVQKEIVASLDELIKQARSQCQKCGASQCSPKTAPRQQVAQPKQKPSEGRGKPSQKPVRNPITKPGQAEPSGLTLEQVKDLIKAVWGELPESEREQMLQSAGDEFLPKYEPLIELYFRRLAEQREPTGN